MTYLELLFFDFERDELPVGLLLHARDVSCSPLVVQRCLLLETWPASIYGFIIAIEADLPPFSAPS